MLFQRVFGVCVRATSALQRGQQSVRLLSIHEHQSLGVLRQFGVNTLRGKVATTPEAAEFAANNLKGSKWVVKSQVLAGGRGRGTFKLSGLQGGVKLASTPKEVGVIAGQMLNDILVTKQTGAKGARVRRLLIQEAVPIKHEAYFACLLDRKSQGPVIVGSPKGGMDIEGVAEETPDQIFSERVNIVTGPTKKQLYGLAEKMGFSDSAMDAAADQLERLYKCFASTDATQLEINPLIETPTGKVICLDAKLNFDDNAEFRQKEIFALRDTTEEDYRDLTAKAYDLNYIGLDGSIGCLVNGAGLAMATMDIIKLHGGSPANFLDIGGGATAQQVTAAFKLLSEDSNVRCILVNIFGGIMRCDVIAQGIVQAAKEVSIDVPLVVRLQGTNQEGGREILRLSGLPIVAAIDLEDAAKKAVAALN